MRRAVAAGIARKCVGRAVIAALVSMPAAASADVFYYKDAQGVFHFTNSKVPGAVLFHMDESVEKLTRSQPESRKLPAYAKGGGDYESIIQKMSDKFDVDPTLVRAVIRAESGFNQRALSPAGARGLMQLMPTTARRHGVRNIHAPEENIRGGVKHLRELLDRYGDNVSMALAAYNAGEGHVDRYRGIPPIPETRSYVARVLKYRREYQRAALVDRAKTNKTVATASSTSK